MAPISSVGSPIDKLTDPEEIKKAAEDAVQRFRQALPKECYQISTLHSMLSLLRDVVLTALVFMVTIFLHKVIPGGIGIIGSVIYAIVQGTVWTGLWVLAHECGHGAFSPSRQVCDAVGFVVHTLLLVPYYSWKSTHAKHHKYTNSLGKGESHVPYTRDQDSWKLARMIRSALLDMDDAFAIVQGIGMLVVGWPAYLIFNETGGRTGVDVDASDVVSASPLRKNHFFADQTSVLFTAKEYRLVLASSVGLAFTIAGLTVWGYFTDFTTVMRWYIGPYLVTNAWLVLYTYLQHTHPDVPHYGDDMHTFQLGALSTIDRPYPWIVDVIHHHIGTTHVVHHINSKVPHYHAKKATEVARKALGDYYRYDDTPIATALFEAVRKCSFVSSASGKQFFHAWSESDTPAVPVTELRKSCKRQEGRPGLDENDGPRAKKVKKVQHVSFPDPAIGA
jgi:omega-6 fatty acid desaturase (delta-12 desaturase)